MQTNTTRPSDPDKPTSPFQDEVREPPAPGDKNEKEEFPRRGDLIDPESPDQDPK